MLAAIYMLWAYERAFTGVPDKPENQKLVDLNLREKLILAPLVLLMLLLGLYPKVLLDRVEPSTEAVLDRIEATTDYRVPVPGRHRAGAADGEWRMIPPPEINWLAVFPLIASGLRGGGGAADRRPVEAPSPLAGAVRQRGDPRGHWQRSPCSKGVAATVSRPGEVTGTSAPFGGMLVIDRIAIFAALLLVVADCPARGWRRVGGSSRASVGVRRRALRLLLLVHRGFRHHASTPHLVMMFLGLEIGSISLYVLAGFSRQERQSEEAAIKYFLLGSFASAIFIYGVALLFAGTGSLSLFEQQQLLSQVILLKPAVLLIGLALMIVGLAFKVTAAPFHGWAPDVYQGAPAGMVGIHGGRGQGGRIRRARPDSRDRFG